MHGDQRVYHNRQVPLVLAVSHKQLLSDFQETELQNNTQSLEESLSGVVRDQCSCNFTSVNLEDSQLTCSDDGMRATFTTTVAYSSNSGDVTATDMITTLKNWADINGADALIQISGTTATVSQVCTPSCDGSGSGGVIAGAFFGGLIAGTILVAIPVIIVWLVIITFSTGTVKISSSYFKLMTKQPVYKNWNSGAKF